MSYNTRRTGVAPGGGTQRAQTTQVNYHQQPARTTATAQSRNPGYTSATNYNSSAQPAYQTQQPQGYSTGTAPLPTAKAPAAPPAPAPAPPAPAPVQAQPPLPTQPPPPTTPMATPKQEPLTPADTPMSEPSENGDGTEKKVPYWKRKGFVKRTLTPQEKKRRQEAKMRQVNHQMRKTLVPKNAIVFLNELRPGQIKFTIEPEGWGQKASVDIEGKVFKGHAMSSAKAKNIAAEQAVKFILLEKLAKGPTPSTPAKKEDKKDEDGDESMDTEEGSNKPKREEDDMPWGSLAAFALHKLFAEWQNEGVALPMQDSPMGMPKQGHRPKPPKEPKPLPAEPQKIHPVMLLNQLRPNLEYTESREVSSSPYEVLFFMTIEIDGEQYVGQGKTKKEAKKNAAKAALIPLGVQYDD